MSLPTKFKVGQIIEDWTEKWEIVSIDGDKMVIKVLKTGPDERGSIGSYVEIGKTYELFRHTSPMTPDEIWEIPGKQMKRIFSQVFLYWFDNGGPGVDLDS